MKYTHYILMTEASYKTERPSFSRYDYQRPVALPTIDALKVDIQTFMRAHSVPYNSGDTKDDLIVKMAAFIVEHETLTASYHPTWEECINQNKQWYAPRVITTNTGVNYVCWKDQLSHLNGEISEFYAHGEGRAFDYCLMNHDEITAWIKEATTPLPEDMPEEEVEEA